MVDPTQESINSREIESIDEMLRFIVFETGEVHLFDYGEFSYNPNTNHIKLTYFSIRRSTTNATFNFYNKYILKNEKYEKEIGVYGYKILGEIDMSFFPIVQLKIALNPDSYNNQRIVGKYEI